MDGILTHSEFGVPYGPLAAAELRGASLNPRADASLPRDASPVMTFSSGRASLGCPLCYGGSPAPRCTVTHKSRGLIISFVLFSSGMAEFVAITRRLCPHLGVPETGAVCARWRNRHATWRRLASLRLSPARRPPSWQGKANRHRKPAALRSALRRRAGAIWDQPPGRQARQLRLLCPRLSHALLLRSHSQPSQLPLPTARSAGGSLVDQWVDYACSSIVSGTTFEPTLGALNAFLAARTFFVGHALSLADVAVWGAIVSARQWDAVRPRAAETLPHLLRWTALLKALAPALGPQGVLAKFAPQKLAAKARASAPCWALPAGLL